MCANRVEDKENVKHLLRVQQQKKEKVCSHKRGADGFSGKVVLKRTHD